MNKTWLMKLSWCNDIACFNFSLDTQIVESKKFFVNLIEDIVKSCKGNQVVWAPVARSSFQRRTRRIPDSIPRENNAWPVRMPLCMSRISRPPLVGRKPVRKQQKKKISCKGIFNASSTMVHKYNDIFFVQTCATCKDNL